MLKSDDEFNELRLVASQIIHDLWKNDSMNQLEILKIQAESSFDDLKKRLNVIENKK